MLLPGTPKAASATSSAETSPRMKRVFTKFSMALHRFGEQRSQCRTYRWSDDRDRGVPPVRPFLTGDRKNRMGDARAQVARGIDRVAGCPAEREADRPHQHP